MSNFIAKAEWILAFRKSGRDNLSYKIQLEKFMRGRRLTHEDFSELIEMKESGVALLNKILTEYRNKILYA
jgi:hypothetical protein